MDLRIDPAPSDEERRAIVAALEHAEVVPHAYTSRWRASALDELRDGALAEERGRDAGVVEP